MASVRVVQIYHWSLSLFVLNIPGNRIFILAKNITKVNIGHYQQWYTGQFDRDV